MILKKENVNDYILAKSRLSPGSRSDDPVEALRSLVLVDSNSLLNTYFSLYLRVKEFDVNMFEKALYKSNRIARVKGLKSTVQVIPKDLLPAVYSLTEHDREDAIGKSLEKWGVKKEEYVEVKKEILSTLGNKEKTLPQIKNGIPAEVSRDIDLRKGRAKERSTNVAVVATAMWDRWMLLRGGIGREPGMDPGRYSVFADRFKDLKLRMDRKDALNMLVRRYVSGYGPVSAEDAAWWCGITANEAASALEGMDGLKTVRVEGSAGDHYIDASEEALISAHRSHGVSVILVPMDDPYVKAYYNRERFVPEGYRDKVLTKFGESINAILINGTVWGTWQLRKEKWGHECVIDLFDGYPEVAGLYESITRVAQDAGMFFTGDIVEVSVST
ncbi:winged helix DNA-binding domain-containing protein [Methanocella sp. CWC-04]|uniref:Winged helix DNA-binding domain-containing protein n=1 Tax=Methanooceanicella nereidis TaxID=2052831 RepID=A0AAP2W7B7_9EURY|nr:winged helix DNA-binding domain-containing protein [Methanocella sp. CWC-04]MCD1296247.1 winged helix DNA-binding domain-containing protein [Methanocella sp. CWC-04]